MYAIFFNKKSTPLRVQNRPPMHTEASKTTFRVQNRPPVHTDIWERVLDACV